MPLLLDLFPLHFVCFLPGFLCFGETPPSLRFVRLPALGSGSFSSSACSVPHSAVCCPCACLCGVLSSPPPPLPPSERGPAAREGATAAPALRTGRRRVVPRSPGARGALPRARGWGSPSLGAATSVAAPNKRLQQRRLCASVCFVRVRSARRAVRAREQPDRPREWVVGCDPGPGVCWQWPGVEVGGRCVPIWFAALRDAWPSPAPAPRAQVGSGPRFLTQAAGGSLASRHHLLQPYFPQYQPWALSLLSFRDGLRAQGSGRAL